MTRTVQVQAPSGAYEVRIGSGLLSSLGERVRALTKAGRCVVVSGENVFPLYGERALRSLRGAGLEADAVVFPAGEHTMSFSSPGCLPVSNTIFAEPSTACAANS